MRRCGSCQRRFTEFGSRHFEASFALSTQSSAATRGDRYKEAGLSAMKHVCSPKLSARRGAKGQRLLAGGRNDRHSAVIGANSVVTRDVGRTEHVFCVYDSVVR
jgi:hypothetical protein